MGNSWLEEWLKRDIELPDGAEDVDAAARCVIWTLVPAETGITDDVAARVRAALHRLYLRAIIDTLCAVSRWIDPFGPHDEDAGRTDALVRACKAFWTGAGRVHVSQHGHRRRRRQGGQALRPQTQPPASPAGGPDA